MVTLKIQLPPEVTPYAEELRRHIDAMVYKLKVHAKKGKWENIDLAQTQELLRAEVDELSDAIKSGNMVEVLLESADVSNYALIISSIAIERGNDDQHAGAGTQLGATVGNR